ncbi:PAC2 family protein [Rothia sp. P4278]|uniref:PAC2 family protein n=1 Tax=Rothia sp. P4278 TaxID=3402658 RepID=UPI003ADB9F77
MFTQPLPHHLLTHYAQKAGKQGQVPPTLLLVAFEGWNDAGESASQAVQLVAEHYQAKPFAGFESESFYSYTESRPHLVPESQGQATGISWPQTRFVEAWSTKGTRILIITGQEPSLSWKNYCQHLLELIDREKVDLVIFCGALLDEVPHTQPAPVGITSFSPTMLVHPGVAPSTYTGPTGIIGVLAHAAGARDIPALSLWASLPHYLAHPPHPKATFSLLSVIEAITGLPMPLEKLADEIMAWERGAKELLEDEPELLAYVQQLESTYERADSIGDISKVDIAAEFEQYLKEQDSEGGSPF